MPTHLMLHNFKCFPQETFRLSHLNLLTGINGTGKSSVLQSLLLLRQSFEMGVLAREGLALNGNLVRLGTAKDVFFEDAKEDLIEIGLGDENGVSSTFRYSYDKSRDFLQSSSALEVPWEQLSQLSLFSDKFHYLHAERSGPRHAFPMSDQHVRVHRQVGADGEFTGHFLDHYRDQKILPVLSHPEAKSNTLLAQVEAWLGEISPGVEIRLEPHTDMDVIKLGFSFVGTHQRTGSFRSTSVGFGISYVLPILAAILSSSSGALILLENPEAHLHPRGQAKMGELMARAASAGIQLIVESHSDHILNGIRIAVRQGILAPKDAAFFFFSRVESDNRMCSKIETPTIDRNGRIDHWPEGFFDEWEKSLESLF
ncbi:MAG: DUF3696 domain-containing protein [Magnetococcales bacterium]|nr:DUF3696 domain-containing protein [Magnetococcales bacterium]